MFIVQTRKVRHLFYLDSNAKIIFVWLCPQVVYLTSGGQVAWPVNGVFFSFEGYTQTYTTCVCVCVCVISLDGVCIVSFRGDICINLSKPLKTIAEKSANQNYQLQVGGLEEKRHIQCWIRTMCQGRRPWVLSEWVGRTREQIRGWNLHPGWRALPPGTRARSSGSHSTHQTHFKKEYSKPSGNQPRPRTTSWPQSLEF